MFNELVINSVQKHQFHSCIFMEEVCLPHNQVLVPEDRNFHHKILTILYCNSSGTSNV